MWRYLSPLADQLSSVLHTFRHNKARSALTLLGMIIGAGSVVLLSGLLAGGQEALVATNQFIDDADVIQIESADPPPRQRGRTSRPLELADGAALDGNPVVGGARAESELFDWQRFARAAGRKKRVLVLGATERAAALYRVEVARGRFLDRDDLERRARVCVVGDEVWRELLGAPERLAGVSLQVSGVRWEVVGVLRRKPPLVAGPGAWMWDRRIVVPTTTFAASIRHSRRVDEIYLRLPAASGPLMQRVEEAQRIVKAMLARRHHGVENFRFAGNEQGQKEQERLIYLVINVLMLCTAVLSLFVGGINIMNIMLVTVTERTREIGIRRSLGATPGNILRQFLLESAIIAALGGLAGVLGGAGLVLLVSKALAAWLGSWNVHYQAWAFAAGLGSSTAIGILFGLYPAWRAARMDPVEALRFE
jgi:putative ABC transport system permease protein